MKKIKLIDENLSGQKGLSRYIDPNNNWFENGEDSEVFIYTDRMGYISELNPNKINCAWIIEPPVINGENYTNISKNKNNFKYVFTYIKNYVNELENYVFIPHGGTWLREEDINIHNKSKLVSCIFSWKNWNSYHRMRFRTYDRLKDDNRVDFYGSGCEKPIDFKIDGLKDYMFSIVIENSIESDYFTEKLLDCFLSGTIPIYVGTKNVSNYFDSNGIIFFEGDEDLPSILDKINESYYMEKLESIKNNFRIAHDYIHPEKIIEKFLNENI